MAWWGWKINLISIHPNKHYAMYKNDTTLSFFAPTISSHFILQCLCQIQFLICMQMCVSDIPHLSIILCYLCHSHAGQVRIFFPQYLTRCLFFDKKNIELLFINCCTTDRNALVFQSQISSLIGNELHINLLISYFHYTCSIIL